MLQTNFNNSSLNIRKIQCDNEHLLCYVQTDPSHVTITLIKIANIFVAKAIFLTETKKGLGTKLNINLRLFISNLTYESVLVIVVPAKRIYKIREILAYSNQCSQSKLIKLFPLNEFMSLLCQKYTNLEKHDLTNVMICLGFDIERVSGNF